MRAPIIAAMTFDGVTLTMTTTIHVRLIGSGLHMQNGPSHSSE